MTPPDDTPEMVEVTALIVELRDAAEEIGGWGAGNEARVVMSAADALEARLASTKALREALALIERNTQYRQQDVRADLRLRLDDACYRARAALAASPPAIPSVPEGWKLVPIEPTREMIDAADDMDADLSEVLGEHARVAHDVAYAAMLAATPDTPPSGSEGETIAQRQARELMTPQSGGITAKSGGQSYGAAIPDRGEMAIPEGMVPWSGGDSAPADWDGGAVLFTTGSGAMPVMRQHVWRHPCPYPGADNIIAYTPRPAASRPDVVEQHVLEAMRAAVTWNLYAHDLRAQTPTFMNDRARLAAARILGISDPPIREGVDAQGQDQGAGKPEPAGGGDG